jgi:predicted small lipoprotein YifL
MNRHKTKMLALGAAVIALAVSLTACGSNQPASSRPASTATPSQAAESSPVTPTDDKATNTGEGEYIGLMDPHSLEIKVDGQTKPFQIDPELATQLSDWEAGTKVKFAYTEEQLDVNGQTITRLTIQSIEKQ